MQVMSAAYEVLQLGPVERNEMDLGASDNVIIVAIEAVGELL